MISCVRAAEAGLLEPYPAYGGALRIPSPVSLGSIAYRGGLIPEPFSPYGTTVGNSGTPLEYSSPYLLVLCGRTVLLLEVRLALLPYRVEGLAITLIDPLR